jgi:hypothetical protein
MIYKHISSKVLIARIYDRFGIAPTDWINSAYGWIGSALNYMNIRGNIQLLQKDVEVVGYRAALPCSFKGLIAIEYNGYRLPRASQLNQPDVCTADNRLPAYYHEEESYVLLTGSSFISTSFETGTIRFHYWGVPVDEEGYPTIPDDEKVLEAIEWYILRTLIGRGFVHTSFNYDTADARWRAAYPRAQNSAKTMDSDERQRALEAWTSLIPNQQAWSSYFYDNTASRFNPDSNNGALI